MGDCPTCRRPILTDDGGSDQSDGHVGHLARREQRLEDVAGARERDDGVSGGQDDDESRPEVEEGGQVAERLARVRVHAAGAADARAQLGEAVRADETDHAARGPHDESQPDGARLGEHAARRHEDPAAHHDADVDGDAVEQAERPLQLHLAARLSAAAAAAARRRCQRLAAVTASVHRVRLQRNAPLL